MELARSTQHHGGNSIAFCQLPGSVRLGKTLAEAISSVDLPATLPEIAIVRWTLPRTGMRLQCQNHNRGNQ